MKKCFSLFVALVIVFLSNNLAVLAEPGLYADDLNSEFMVGGTAWQLSAECRALYEQSFNTATLNVCRAMELCLDPDERDWVYDAAANAMYYQGLRVAVISDIDETLVNGTRLTCSILANGGAMSNIGMIRFVMNGGCRPTPGSLDFIRFCEGNGIEVYFISNRSDQGYKIGQSDESGSYEAAVGDARGAYIDGAGEEIGASVYQCLGKSCYDITMESMLALGFPVDDQHLILNDEHLKGNSKAPARQAVIQGSEAYPNGQRDSENTTGTSLTAAISAHYVLMLLGDDLGDLTDDFSTEGLDAFTRADKVLDYAGDFGTKWIVMPNAVYGDSYTYAEAYGLHDLLEAAAKK